MINQFETKMHPLAGEGRAGAAVLAVLPGIDPGYSRIPQSKIIMCNL